MVATGLRTSLVEAFLLRRQEAVQLLYENYHFLRDLLCRDGSAELPYPFLLDFIHRRLNSPFVGDRFW
jgi:hypothetical protein